MNRHHPIIYVRGFAATQGEIEDTVADPYMGFNVGSTKARRAWDGKIQRYYFESPLVRLMSDHGYNDVFVEGEDLLLADRPRGDISYRSIIIHRYYDEASSDFGDGDTPPIEVFASKLSTLILRLRDRICANPDNKVTKEAFRVYLVAHSMGGLVCRAMLQNPALDAAGASKYVDKLFTYATPHNGIDLRIVRNVPGWLSFGDVNNFNRKRMASYLNLAGIPGTGEGEDVSVVHNFPAERVFNLVGTNASDYAVLRGLSAWASGEAGDGLVRIANATTHGPTQPDGTRVTSPRAFVHRSHSGHYGIVNSEEGYQNLTRFLFGALRVDGVLHVDEVSLPVEVQDAQLQGKDIKASYQFDVAVSIRGSQWHVTRRETRENSAIFRTFDDLFPNGNTAGRRNDSRSPHLFSVFLDPDKSVSESGSVSFACDLKALVPDYQVDGAMFLKRHYEGGHLLRRLVLIEAFKASDSPGGWRINFGCMEEGDALPNRQADVTVLPGGGIAFEIPLKQLTKPGMRARLRVEARPWQ